MVAYFSYDGAAVAIPCDRWIKIEHNVKAIALTIEAMRGMERWGAKHMIRAMFTGFKALPASSKRHWTDVLGIASTCGKDFAEMAFRTLAKKHHPDNGGDTALMQEVNAAWSECKAEKGWS